MPLRLIQNDKIESRPAQPRGGVAPRVAACVAIPARNEEARIGGCLEALTDQSTREPYAVLVLANNCTDGTAAVVRDVARRSNVPVILREIALEGAYANAGCARRRALDAALELVEPDGAIMTTDADSRVNRSWVSANLSELRAGADIVCGSVTPDFMEPALFPAHVYPQGALEYLYQRMLAELDSVLDPLPWDPWPRHLIESGASLAVRAEVYTRVGGAPEVARGEDRAFVDRVRRAGGRVRHAMEARVATSCRIDGRAQGGWADDLARRARDPKATCHEMIEPADDAARRAALRGGLRAIWPIVEPAASAQDTGAPELLIAALIEAGAGFEEAWAQIEAASPLLLRRRVSAKDLPSEAHKLKKALDRARAIAASRRKLRLGTSDPSSSPSKIWPWGAKDGQLYAGQPSKRRLFVTTPKG